MSKIIEVKFLSQREDGDLFIKTGIRKKYYIRKAASEHGENKVIWVSAKKTDDGYNAVAPLKAGKTVRVIAGKRKEKKIYFEEHIVPVSENASATCAEKAAGFAYEQLATAEQRIQEEHNLISYEDWADRLTQLGPQYGYTGYPDNWLHFGTDKLESDTAETIDVMGISYPVIATTWKHKICNLSWKIYEVFDKDGGHVSMCGYEILP